MSTKFYELGIIMKLRLVLLFAFLAFNHFTSASEEAYLLKRKKSRHASITVLYKEGEKFAKPVYKTVVQLHSKLQGIWGKSKTLEPLKIRLHDKKKKSKLNFLWLVPAELKKMNNFQFLRKMIIFMTPRYTGNMKSIIPEWLVAAMIYRVQAFDQQSIKPIPDYAVLRKIILSEENLSLKHLLIKPPPVNLPILYALYSQHCSVLLRAIITERKSKKKLRNIVDYTIVGDDADKLVDALEFDDYDDLILWFRGKAWEAAVNPIYTLPPDYIKQKIQKITTVSIMSPSTESGDKLKRLKIENLDKMQSYVLDKENIRSIQEEFYKILISSPEDLRPYIGAFAKALSFLARDQFYVFKSALINAREKIKPILEKKIILNDYLNQCEIEYSKILSEKSFILGLMEEYEKKDYQLSKPWKDYLKTLENEILN